MFSWKNLQKPELFSIYPKSVNKNWDQRKFNRKFRNITRDHRPKERALGPRLERWKWHRFLDGNFSSFRQKFDDLILIPAGSVLACIVVLGMFIVQLDYVDEYHYRQFMMIMLVVLGLGTTSTASCGVLWCSHLGCELRSGSN